MSNFAKNCQSTVIPGMRYQNAPAAIEWLCKAFGFEKKAVYANPDGSIGHAELTFGNGMVMLGSVKEGPYDEHIRQPNQLGGHETQSPYLIVSDCEAIYRQAKAAGAEMVMDLETKEYGGSGFTCKDPEGHLWSVGSYDPWEVS
jgi:uncharacterized glyoxalase superfamily protein PhnB